MVVQLYVVWMLGVYIPKRNCNFPALHAAHSLLVVGLLWVRVLTMLSGVAVSSGVRYILTGFCSYAPPPPPARGSGRDSDSDDLHHFFMRDYCPDSDGRAAGAGIRTGDTLTAVHLPDYRPSDSDSDATVTLIFLVIVIIR